MALSCKVDDNIKLLFLAKVKNKLAVADIAVNEAEVIASCSVKSVEVACIGQRINTYETVVGMLFLHIINEIASDKSGTAGNENVLHRNSPYKMLIALYTIFMKNKRGIYE